MTTDTMRGKFETETAVWKDRLNRDDDGDYACEDTHNMWMGFRAGYQQGQRDLINSMHVVGYRYYVDKMDYWELVEDPVAHRICYPVYILPEDTTK